MQISDHARQNLLDLHGERGARWLDELPGVVTRCARRWSLTLGAPHAASYAYVVSATRGDGTRVVLKLAPPGKDAEAEAEALRRTDGRGAVRLLDLEPAWMAMLLEAVEPGTPLSTLCAADDARATEIAAGVMRRIWRAVPGEHPFPTVETWMDGLRRMRARERLPIDRAVVDEAAAMGAELLASSNERVLLHGDLHHDNILAAGREPWLAIDPKGLVGEPAFEVGALLRNPRPLILAADDRVALMTRRVWRLAEALEMERERVRAWGWVGAVLSAWWSIEDHGSDWEFSMLCADALRRVRV